MCELTGAGSMHETMPANATAAREAGEARTHLLRRPVGRLLPRLVAVLEGAVIAELAVPFSEKLARHIAGVPASGPRACALALATALGRAAALRCIRPFARLGF